MPIVLVLGVLLVVEVLALAKLAYSVKLYKQHWQKQNNTSEAEIKYIALGDSAAQGIGASRPEKGYVGLLTARLDASGKMLNLSVSGAKVQDVIDTQLPILKQRVNDGTAVTLAIGANDMASFDPRTFESQMNDLLTQLTPQAVVADIPYFGGGRFRKLEANAEAANQIIHRLVKTHGVRLAELHKITKEKDSLLVYAPDLFHPSNTGYRNWAAAFYQAWGF